MGRIPIRGFADSALGFGGFWYIAPMRTGTHNAGGGATVVPGAWDPRRRRDDGDAAKLYLVPVAGPERAALALDPAAEGAADDGGEGLLLGRHDSCPLHLPGSEKVSRRHARFRHDPATGRWTVEDAGSSWGTRVNGRSVTNELPATLAEGDLVRVAPWTFLVSASPAPRGLRPGEEPTAAAGSVKSVRDEEIAPLQRGRLALLLSSAAELQDAADERDLAGRLLRLAQSGTGLRNAAVLKPVSADGRYDVLASEGGEGLSFSRSLLSASAAGQVAEVRGDAGGGPAGVGEVGEETSESIVQMRITRAVCVPVMLGEAVSLLLYLDQRNETFVDHDHGGEAATAYLASLGKVASLALSNLKRIEMERRNAEVEADLRAAAAAQRWILPPRELELCGYRITGVSRPGRGGVGGDFFDAIDLGRDRLVVAVGDVSGKGAGAGILMTATQSFLHAILNEPCDDGTPPDLAKAVTRLGGFVHPRRPATRFVTLWVGLFDRAEGTLTYVDAGHGLGLVRRRGEDCRELAGGGGMPVGILADAAYEAVTVPFAPGDAALVVSDGICEQPAGKPPAGERDEFGLSRSGDVLCAGGEDVVSDLFAAVVAHAGTDRLADDATAVLVRG